MGMSRVFPTPALETWRAELRAGMRTATTFDPLWRAACWEASAVEAATQGFRDAAHRDLQRARQIIDEAATPHHPQTAT